MRKLLYLLAMLATPAMALEVNTATKAELEAAGFSSDDAQSILDARQSKTFSSSNDLLEVNGISQGDLNRVRATLTIDGKPVTTRSGTAPAIPGERPAIPNKQGESESEQHDKSEQHGKGESESEHSGGHESNHESNHESDHESDHGGDKSGKGG